MASSISLPSFAAKTSNILNPDGTSIDQSFAPTNGGMFRNRIINGDMRIDQRNAGAEITPVAGATYSADRFALETSVASKLKLRQVSTVSTDANFEAGAAPAGFTKSIKVSVFSQYSPASTDNLGLYQGIEGANFADLDFGISSAQAFTISFWIKGSITGKYSLSMRNSGDTRTYIANYNILQANTWEYKTITIAGDTAGTWLKDSGRGILIAWNLGAGTNFESTAGAWVTTSGSPKLATSDSIDFVNQINGSTLYITGVQLEKGSSATPFEVRPIGVETQLCYRYFYRTASPVQSAVAAAGWIMTFVEYFPVPMRTDTPTELGTTLTCELANPTGGYEDDGVPVSVAVWSRFSIRYEVISGTVPVYFRALSRDRQISAEL